MTANDLRAQRDKLGLTRLQLAQLLGTTESTVYRLEAGATPLNTRWQGHIALALASYLEQLETQP